MPGFIENLSAKRTQWLQQAFPTAFTCNRCDTLLPPGSVSSFAITRCTQPPQQPFPLQRPRNGILFLVVDLLDFPGSLLNPSHPERSLLGERAVAEAIELPTVLIGNKVDLLLSKDHKSEHPEKLCKWLEASAMTLGMRRPIQTLLTSAHSGYGIGPLMRAILTLGKRTDRSRGNAFLVGATNVGKSMLWNSLMQHAGLLGRTSLFRPQATCSSEPGTTLGYLRVPLRDLARGSGIRRFALKEPPMGYLYDTPGVFNHSSLISLLSPIEIVEGERRQRENGKNSRNAANIPSSTEESHRESCTNVLDSTEQKVKNLKFHLSPGKSLYLGKLCQIQVLEGGTTISLVVSQTIAPVQVLNEPLALEMNVAYRIEKSAFAFESAIQVALSGIGYATFTKPASIEIRTPSGEGIHPRDVPIQNKP